MKEEEMPENSTHPLYDDNVEDWENCRNFYLGQKQVKSEGVRYLPKPEGMSKLEYDNYKFRASFFAPLDRTIAGMSGAINRKEPTIELPKSGSLDFLKNNADANNSSLRQFANAVVMETMLTGRGGVLVERDEDASIEPYLVYYQAESIINWTEDAEQNLTMVVLRECTYETSASDIFQKTKVKRYRVLLLEDGRYIQRLFAETLVKQDKGADQVQITKIGQDIEPVKNGKYLTYIPFVFCNVSTTSTKIDKPPFLDLVEKCNEYYVVGADYANSCYFVGNPILVVKGAKLPAALPSPPRNLTGQTVGDDYYYESVRQPKFELTLGSSRATSLPENASIELVESKGAGVEPNRQRLLDIKQDMIVLGSRILENQRTGVEAAETAQIRQSGETSTLASIVINVSACIQKALLYLAEWSLGIVNEEEIKFNLNDDFVDVTLNPQLVSQLQSLVVQGLMSWETFYYNLTIGELTIPGRTAEEERAAIESDPLPAIQTVSNEDFSNVISTGLNLPIDEDNEDGKTNNE